MRGQDALDPAEERPLAVLDVARGDVLRHDLLVRARLEARVREQRLHLRREGDAPARQAC